MALLTILEFPDPRLRQHAQPVAVVDDGIRRLVDDMFETMYHAPGVGLAATQVNVQQRVVVIDVTEDKSEPLVFINPEITVLDEAQCEYDEGCLSVPGFYETVVRPQHIRVHALDRNGVMCIQHEVDHLNGKLFVDHISSLKRDRIRKKLEKKHRDGE
jgi:peptide deformylase